MMVRVSLVLDVGLDEARTLEFVQLLVQAGALNHCLVEDDLVKRFLGLKPKFTAEYSSCLVPENPCKSVNGGVD